MWLEMAKKKNENKVRVLVLLLAALCNYHETEASYTNFDLKRFEVCDNSYNEIQLNATMTKEKGNHYLTHNTTFKIPVGDNVGLTCLIQTKTAGGIFVDLFTIREKNICKAFNKYMGEFWYDIERGSQITPGVCPIREGRYHAHHILVNFNKITLQTFPFGRLRFTMHAVDNKNNKNIMCCLSIEVENVIN